LEYQPNARRRWLDVLLPVSANAPLDEESSGAEDTDDSSDLASNEESVASSPKRGGPTAGDGSPVAPPSKRTRLAVGAPPSPPSRLDGTSDSASGAAAMHPDDVAGLAHRMREHLRAAREAADSAHHLMEHALQLPPTLLDQFLAAAGLDEYDAALLRSVRSQRGGEMST